MGLARLKMNKKGLEFKAGMYAIVAISLMVLAYAIIIDEQADMYGTNATSELGAFNKLNSVSSTARGYESSLTPEDPEPGQDPEAGTFRGVYGIITGLFGAFDIVVGDGGMVDSVVTQLGLPLWVKQGVITLMFIAIAFSIVAVIFRLSKGTA